MSGFTPGPWVVNPIDAQIDAPFDGAPVCQLLWPTDVRSKETTAANGNLIAAAPDLLEAAHLVVTGLNARIDAADLSAVPVFDGIADLVAAIAKATGK